MSFDDDAPAFYLEPFNLSYKNPTPRSCSAKSRRSFLFLPLALSTLHLNRTSKAPQQSRAHHECAPPRRYGSLTFMSAATAYSCITLLLPFCKHYLQVPALLHWETQHSPSCLRVATKRSAFANSLQRLKKKKKRSNIHRGFALLPFFFLSHAHVSLCQGA